MLFRLPSEEELTDNKLNEFIAKHNAECAFRFKHLKDAYETDYQIFHQKPKPDYKPDNRIAVNFAKYMVDTFNGYFIGNPIRISVDNDTNDNIKKYVELLDQYNDQDDNNAELSKICCIYGKGYEMYYVDELGNIGITYLTPFDAFMIYDDSVLCREQYFVRLYIDSNDVLHGSVSDDTKVRWFTQKGKLVWEEEEKIHGFDGVPATEYVENKERTCIFEPVMSMIDAYNKAISEKSNDVDYFADAYMKILGIDTYNDTNGSSSSYGAGSTYYMGKDPAGNAAQLAVNYYQLVYGDRAAGTKTSLTPMNGDWWVGAGDPWNGDNDTVLPIYASLNHLIQKTTGMIAGSKVVQIANGKDSVALFTAAEVATLLGIADGGSVNATVTISNGDGAAYGIHVEGCTYQNDIWYACFAGRNNSGNSLPVRINYIIMAI